MAITAREKAKREREARAERERDARKADRAKLRALRFNIKRARITRRERRHEVVKLCRAGRARVRDMAKLVRARARVAANDEIAAARAQARSACEARKHKARTIGGDSLRRAAAVLEAERRHQEQQRIWRSPPKLGKGTRGPKRSTAPRAAERRHESDSEVENNLPAELVQVWRAVKRERFTENAHRTRTEHFLHWAQENPGEVVSIIDRQTEQDVAKLIAEEARLRREVVRPSTYRKATDLELEQRRSSGASAARVAHVARDSAQRKTGKRSAASAGSAGPVPF